MSRPSVKERRDEMIAKLKMAGKNGIETKKFINDFTNKWGYKRTTVKKDTLELVELEKAKIDKTRIYHSMYIAHQARCGIGFIHAISLVNLKR